MLANLEKLTRPNNEPEQKIAEICPKPRYEHYQLRALEASAETLKDPILLREVHDWEKNASRNDPRPDGKVEPSPERSCRLGGRGGKGAAASTF